MVKDCFDGKKLESGVVSVHAASSMSPTSKGLIVVLVTVGNYLAVEYALLLGFFVSGISVQGQRARRTAHRKHSPSGAPCNTLFDWANTMGDLGSSTRAVWAPKQTVEHSFVRILETAHYPCRFTITEPTEYPAPNEQISPTSPSAKSSEYLENAMIDPAEDVFA